MVRPVLEGSDVSACCAGACTTGCYGSPGGAVLLGCTCHASCEACGYTDSPTGAADCITCADKSTVKAVYDDGTGLCGEFTDESGLADEGCYTDPWTSVPGCTCHASCKACGYTDSPTGAADCITCADGSVVQAVYSDGTGRCGEFTGAAGQLLLGEGAATRLAMVAAASLLARHAACA